MGDYIKGQPSASQAHNIQVTHTTVDANDIANAVAKAIAHLVGQIPAQGVHAANAPMDDFKETDSLAKIAEAMTVQRSNSESNFGQGLGGVKKIKKNQKELKSTLDLLKGLDN